MGSSKRPAGTPRTTPKDKLRLPERGQEPARAGKPGGRKSAPPDPSGRERTPADYYRLNTRAVEDLVTANEENSPPVPASELRKYHTGPRVHLADWVKAVLLKIWFPGMICYFFIWGLSTVAINAWDQLVILGVVLGGATHLLTNNIFRFIAKEEGAYDRWMMFPRKSLAFLPLDILYATALVLCTMKTYQAVNLLAAGGAPDGGTALGVEPILFGVFTALWDLLFLALKRFFLRILADARRKASSGS